MLTRTADPDELFAHSLKFPDLNNRQAYWKSARKQRKAWKGDVARRNGFERKIVQPRRIRFNNRGKSVRGGSSPAEPCVAATPAATPSRSHSAGEAPRRI